MRQKYRLFRRSTGIYFIQDNTTGKQESLKTRNKQEAATLLNASNEANRQPFLNLQIARTYLRGTDPRMVTRTWQEVMEKIVTLKKGPTRDRWEGAIEDRALDSIRSLPLLETRADHFLKVLATEKSSTNAYLRRTHNTSRGAGSPRTSASSGISSETPTRTSTSPGRGRGEPRWTRPCRRRQAARTSGRRDRRPARAKPLGRAAVRLNRYSSPRRRRGTESAEEKTGCYRLTAHPTGERLFLSNPLLVLRVSVPLWLK